MRFPPVRASLPPFVSTALSGRDCRLARAFAALGIPGLMDIGPSSVAFIRLLIIAVAHQMGEFPGHARTATAMAAGQAIRLAAASPKIGSLQK